jgi:hypothetical protein
MAQQIDSDMREQALSYLRHQATKSLGELAAQMERTAQDCADCLDGVSEAQGSFKPELSDAEGHEEEWSMREVVEHMIGSSRAVNREIANLATGRGATIEALTGLTVRSERGIEELRSALAGLWSETGALVASLPEDAALDKTWDHPWFGALNFREWIAFQRMHALDHVQQMDKLKAQPGYPKV